MGGRLRAAISQWPRGAIRPDQKSGPIRRAVRPLSRPATTSADAGGGARGGRGGLNPLVPLTPRSETDFGERVTLPPSPAGSRPKTGGTTRRRVESVLRRIASLTDGRLLRTAFQKVSAPLFSSPRFAPFCKLDFLCYYRSAALHYAVIHCVQIGRSSTSVPSTIWISNNTTSQ